MTCKPPHPHGDGLSTLDYLSLWIEANEKLNDQRFAAIREAVTKAETATERRFESVNEFRNTLKDQTASFVTQPEIRAYDSKIEDIKKDIQSLRESRSGYAGEQSRGAADRGNSQWMIGLIAGIIGAVIGAIIGTIVPVVALFMHGR